MHTSTFFSWVINGLISLIPLRETFFDCGETALESNFIHKIAPQDFRRKNDTTKLRPVTLGLKEAEGSQLVGAMRQSLMDTSSTMLKTACPGLGLPGWSVISTLPIRSREGFQSRHATRELELERVLFGRGVVVFTGRLIPCVQAKTNCRMLAITPVRDEICRAARIVSGRQPKLFHLLVCPRRQFSCIFNSTLCPRIEFGVNCRLQRSSQLEMKFPTKGQQHLITIRVGSWQIAKYLAQASLDRGLCIRRHRLPRPRPP